MRNLFALALFTLFMTSCGPKFYTTTSLVDLRPYTERGFFITQSNSVSFEYEPIGIVYSSAYSGEYRGPRSDTQRSSFDYNSFTTIREASVSDAVYALYVRCLNEGGDAIINLEYNVVIDKKGGKNKVIEAYASGMAIRRVKE